MSWKGTLRAYQSAVNRSERAARKRQRELELQQKNFNKMQEFERAKFEVLLYENNLDLVLSLHKDCGDIWDWVSINNSKPIEKPTKLNKLELQARSELTNYKPGTVDKIFNKVKTKQEQLSRAVQMAINNDEKIYEDELNNYQIQLKEWETLNNLSSRILNHEPQSYIDAIKFIKPFNEIEKLGAVLSFNNIGNSIDVTFYPNDEKIIPIESKSLLQSGKLSVKETPRSKLYQMYQDYICSATLRISRELFALLPIDIVFITAVKKLLNNQTGHLENKPILSVVIPKETLEIVNFDLIDPSDSMNNFVHNMKFNKANGFAEIEKISPERFL